MKVLIIGPFPPVVNGVTICNEYLLQSLTANGLNVSRINTETGKIASLQGDKISIRKILAFLTIYLEIFKTFSNDVVYMTTGQTFWGVVKYLPFVMVCKLVRIPYVLHVHGGYMCTAYLKLTGSKKAVFKYIVNNSKTVIALSDSLALEIKQVFETERVEVVENFYDPKLIDPLFKRAESPIPRFLFLSNLMLGKGILEFLDALILLRDIHKVEFTVSIAGTMEKGIEQTLNEKVKQLGNKVVFLGLADFDKKKELLYNSDIFVLPTWYIMEGQPISIIEAYVTGNVVVSTHQGGIKDISKYETFFKTQQQDPEKLATTLVNVVAQLPNISEERNQTAKAAQNRFDSTRFVKQMEDILNSTN